jgi:hypothetical protein
VEIQLNASVWCLRGRTNTKVCSTNFRLDEKRNKTQIRCLT